MTRKYHLFLMDADEHSTVIDKTFWCTATTSTGETEMTEQALGYTLLILARERDAIRRKKDAA